MKKHKGDFFIYIYYLPEIVVHTLPYERASWRHGGTTGHIMSISSIIYTVCRPNESTCNQESLKPDKSIYQARRKELTELLSISFLTLIMTPLIWKLSCIYKKVRFLKPKKKYYICEFQISSFHYHLLLLQSYSTSESSSCFWTTAPIRDYQVWVCTQRVHQKCGEKKKKTNLASCYLTNLISHLSPLLCDPNVWKQQSSQA